MKQSGVNIVAINASYGCQGCFDTLEKDAIQAAGEAGIIFVAAAGNESADTDTNPHYPSAFDSSNIISVAATDMDDALASFSNYGLTTVDLGAPGYRVLNTYFQYQYLPDQNSDFFFDDMESGSGDWTAQGDWAITEEQASSPTHAWSDSPGTDYGNNNADSLTSPVIDMGAASGPVFLGFSAKYELEEDNDLVEVYFKVPKTVSWERTTEQAHGGTYAWSDSPGGQYPNDSDNWLASPILDLSTAKKSAELSFWLSGIVEANFDYLDVYFSADSGNQWSYQGSVTGDTSGQWQQFSASISSEFRTSQFRVAFVLWSDSVVTEDGYYVDDVEIRDNTTQFFFDDMESGDNGWAQPVAPWEGQGFFTGSSGGNWETFNVPIDESYFWEGFQVRFVLSSNFIVNADGVYLDDMGVGVGDPVHGYAYMNGTSMAAPHVTGAVALMAAEYPNESVNDLIRRVLGGTDSLPSLTGLVATDGRLNLWNSLVFVQPCEGDLDPDGDVDGLDLEAFAEAYGADDPDADLNNSGNVDEDDLAIFAEDFGRRDCP
jgi:subtilisin family serine protease